MIRPKMVSALRKDPIAARHYQYYMKEWLELLQSNPLAHSQIFRITQIIHRSSTVIFLFCSASPLTHTAQLFIHVFQVRCALDILLKDGLFCTTTYLSIQKK